MATNYLNSFLNKMGSRGVGGLSAGMPPSNSIDPMTPSEQLATIYQRRQKRAEMADKMLMQADNVGSALGSGIASVFANKRASEALGGFNEAQAREDEQLLESLPEDMRGAIGNLPRKERNELIQKAFLSQYEKPKTQVIKTDRGLFNYNPATGETTRIEDPEGNKLQVPQKKDDSNNLIADIVTRKRIENDLKAGMSNEEISRKYFPTQEQKQENIQKAKYDVQLKKSYAPNRTAIKQFKNEVNGLNKRIDAAIKIIEKGEKDIVNLSTGFTGSALSIVPADTDARKLSNILDQLRAFKGFSALQNMRNNSPTGGALGQVSERENILLQSLSGTLDQATPGQLLEGLKTLRDVQLPETLKDRVEAFNLDYGNKPDLYSDKEKFTNKILGKKSGKIRIKKISQKQ